MNVKAEEVAKTVEAILIGKVMARAIDGRVIQIDYHTDLL